MHASSHHHSSPREGSGSRRRRRGLPGRHHVSPLVGLVEGVLAGRGVAGVDLRGAVTASSAAKARSTRSARRSPSVSARSRCRSGRHFVPALGRRCRGRAARHRDRGPERGVGVASPPRPGVGHRRRGRPRRPASGSVRLPCDPFLPVDCVGAAAGEVVRCRRRSGYASSSSSNPERLSGRPANTTHEPPQPGRYPRRLVATRSAGPSGAPDWARSGAAP